MKNTVVMCLAWSLLFGVLAAADAAVTEIDPVPSAEPNQIIAVKAFI